MASSCTASYPRRRDSTCKGQSIDDNDSISVYSDTKKAREGEGREGREEKERKGGEGTEGRGGKEGNI